METFADDVRRNPATAAFKCLACSGPLTYTNQDPLQCPACGKSWPVRDGIPRFFEPSYYWGEVPESEAEEFIRQAAESGWRAAALKRFADDRDMRTSLTDWQRASWLPLLALDSNSVALDVGGGYGALTHSLSRAAGQVFTLEAIRERIDFIRIRLSQEGVSNVQLVQATAIDPPFADQMFDLIVVNGVLEWVGEWDHQGNPRDVQVNFLKRLRRSLKPGGVMLVGIENRFGYSSFYGSIDHSGLPYTNLMPRGMASWWLRRSTRAHNRTSLNPKREYRTYTYGAQGFRKLMADSGFPGTVFYWPDPDYNQPYSLIPLEDVRISERVDSLMSEPTVPLHYGAVQMVKRWMARCGILRRVVPSFVFLASESADPPRPRFWRQLRADLPGLPELRAPTFFFTSNPLGLKSVIRVFEDGAAEPACIVKTTTAAPSGSSSLDGEYRCLELVSQCCGKRRDLSFSVPRPYGLTKIGNLGYLAESVGSGRPLSLIVFPSKGRKRFEILRKALVDLVKGAIQIGQVFTQEEAGEPMDPGFLSPPERIAADPGGGAQLQALLARCPTGSVQHGDFTLENIFQDSKGHLTIIDWEHMFRGASPLHDVFTLLVSVTLGDDGISGYTNEASLARFEAAFFGSGRWTGPFRAAVLEACGALGLREHDVLPMLVHFLLLRFNQLKSRNSPLAGAHADFLASALRHTGTFMIRG